MIVLIFLAMTMVTSCASSKPKITWTDQDNFNLQIRTNQNRIDSIETQLKKLGEADILTLKGIEEIKANLGLETTETEVVVASAETEKPEITEEPEKEIVESPTKPKETPVIKIQRLESLVAQAKKAKVKSIKTIFNNLTEQQEIWVQETNYRITELEKKVNIHDKQFAKMSDLQKRLAEVEDEIRPIYLWTKSFPSGKPKKPGEKEELPLPPAKVQAGLDRMAIEILAGRIEIQSDVVGYADPRGKKKDNEELSKRRAQASINYLISKLGPDKEVIWEPGTTWKEYFQAVAGGETGRYGNFKYNRRVRFEKTH